MIEENNSILECMSITINNVTVVYNKCCEFTSPKPYKEILGFKTYDLKHTYLLKAIY